MVTKQDFEEIRKLVDSWDIKPEQFYVSPDHWRHLLRWESMQKIHRIYIYALKSKYQLQCCEHDINSYDIIINFPKSSRLVPFTICLSPIEDEEKNDK
jgi:hypothetical protein